MTIRTLEASDHARSFVDALGRILSAPMGAAKRVGQALDRSRERAQMRAELAALDQRLLVDLGLRRSLIDPSRLCQQPPV